MKKHVLTIAALSFAFAGFAKGPNFAIDYGDISAYDPEDINAPGTEIDIYFARRAEFDVLQDAGAITTIDDWGVVATAHTFTTTNGFHKIHCFVPDQNAVQHEFGEYGGGVKNTARIFLKGNQAAVRGLVSQLNNDDCIFIIPLKDGQRAQIGSPHAIVKVKASFDSKVDNSQDPRGWEVMLECSDKHALYYDTGLAITLHS